MVAGAWPKPELLPMKRLPLILSALYWVIAGLFLWGGYRGDSEMDRASLTPVTHSAEFDVMAALVLATVIYVVVAGLWWVVARVMRRPAPTAGPSSS
jgi:hypothetical protein